MNTLPKRTTPKKNTKSFNSVRATSSGGIFWYSPTTVKEKYGSDAELDEEGNEEDSEEDESEDEDGEELTPAMDVAMLLTLAKIRNKDPVIYDSKKNVFERELFTLAGSQNIDTVLYLEEQQTRESMKIKRRKKDKVRVMSL
jgi:hypothetical protein